MSRATCAVALGALWLAAVPATAAPLVTSDSDCPSAADVVTRLTGLWTADNPASAAAHIHVGVGQMTVELVSENDPATTRVLPAEPACESRAQAAALIIAAWLDSMPADPLGQVESVAALSVEPAGPKTPAGETPLPQSQFSLGLGAFASLDTRGAGAALFGEAAWARVVSRFGLAATLSAPLPRELGLGPGTALWWRPAVALTLCAPLTQGALILDGGVGPVFGLLLVAGRGFNSNHTDVAVSWGATAAVRLAHRRGHAGAYWAELRTLVWPATQNIRNDVAGATPRLAALPRIEGQLGLGFSFGAL